jgi:hypothetical protein
MTSNSYNLVGETDVNLIFQRKWKYTIAFPFTTS